MLTPAHGAVLGLAQGLAEVLPVSSSAQLAVLPGLLGWPEPPSPTLLAAVLHAGSCAGLSWALRRDLRRLSRRERIELLVVSAPAAAAGLLAGDRRAAGAGRRMALLLAAGGAAHWLADRRPAEHPVRNRDAAAAALAQVLALAPGVSRSGAALTALRAGGVERVAAQRYTLLMSVPITGGAAAVTLLRADPGALRATARALATGVPVAAVAAAAAGGWARRGPLPVAATTLYRLALAALLASRYRRETT